MDALISLLEVLEVPSGRRTVVQEFDRRIEAPNWTPDGQSLIFNSQGRLESLELATGRTTLLPTGFCNRCNNDHVLSPDGTRVAVSHHTAEDGRSRIYVIPLAGGPPTLVTTLGPSYLHGWSPGGEELAYCAERGGEYDVYTIPVHGGVESRLTNSPGLNDGPEYSPCGRYLWFNSVRTGLMQLWRMDRDGSNQVPMTDDQANSWFPHLSPGGTQVVYLAYRKGDVDPGDHPPGKTVEIRLMAAEGGPFQTLATLWGGQGTLNVNSWSPDGSRLAFVSYRSRS